MAATIRLVLVTAIRDRLLLGLLLALALACSLSAFLGGQTLVERLQTAMVFAAGGGRLVLVLTLSFFAALHIQNLFDSREVEAILSRALTRWQFVLAYWIGMALIAAVVAGAFGLLVAYAAGGTGGAFLWAGSLVAECTMVVAVTVFAGVMLERATQTMLFVMGFYALARLMGFFAGIRETVTRESWIEDLVTRGLDVILLFIPRLDLFAQSQWLVYDVKLPDITFVAIQAALFLALVLTAAAVDLRRKQF